MICKKAYTHLYACLDELAILGSNKSPSTPSYRSKATTFDGNYSFQLIDIRHMKENNKS